MITGTFSFMIPALSLAISSLVFPSNLSWSMPMDVIIDSSGFIRLVVSNLPPNPTSIEAKSHFCSLK